jgi:hypothetical protein
MCVCGRARFSGTCARSVALLLPSATTAHITTPTDRLITAPPRFYGDCEQRRICARHGTASPVTRKHIA